MSPPAGIEGTIVESAEPFKYGWLSEGGMGRSTMNRIHSAVLALLLAAGAQAAQDKKEVDRIGKDKAPVVLKKALAEIQKRKSSAISESAEMATGPRKLANT